MSKADSVRALVKQTLEVLERDGWCKGQMTDEAGRRCALGALYEAQYELQTSDPDAFDSSALHVLKVALTPTLIKASENKVDYLSKFNDLESTTLQDVQRVFTEACEQACELARDAC